MTKQITLKVINKTDYYSEAGEWDEVEEFLEENNLTEDEFTELQDKVDQEPDIITLTVDESDINEFLQDTEDPNSTITTKVYETLWDKYNIQVTSFDIIVLSIK